MTNQDLKNNLTEKMANSLGFLMQDVLQVQLEIEQKNELIRILDIKLIQLRQEITTIDLDTSKEELFSPTYNNKKSSRSSELLNEEKMIIERINDTYKGLSKLIQRKNNIDNVIKCIELVKNDISQGDNLLYNNTEYGIKILETQESERKRIARDLHDTTVQNLTNMMHKTELCFKLTDIDPVRSKIELQTMIKTIKTTIKDMRGIIYDLRPMSLDDLGLIPTIEKYIREIRNSHEIEVTLEVTNDEVKVLSVINLTIFRIIQEALNNALKHGKATKINIKIEYIDNFIELCIKDNGLGFTEAKHIDNNEDILSGYGLSMMKERVILLSGEININSKTNEGTEIFVKVPLRTYKEDI